MEGQDDTADQSLLDLCPDRFSAERLHTEPCNEQKNCTSQSVPPKCADKIDLLFLLDSSGSMGTSGLEDSKKFVNAVAARMDLNPQKGGRIAVSHFNSQAARLTVGFQTDAAALKKTLDEKFPTTPAGHTNLPEALSLAVTDLGADDVGNEACYLRRSGVLPIVVILTDGMPASRHLAESEVTKLKRVARVLLVNVGAATNKRVLKKMVSWPVLENFMVVSSSGGLGEAEFVTDFLANVCRKLE